MGIQQASGALFIEFFSAIYAEFYDAFKNGFIDGVNAQGIIEATRKRFVRILKRVRIPMERTCKGIQRRGHQRIFEQYTDDNY